MIKLVKNINFTEFYNNTGYSVFYSTKSYDYNLCSSGIESILIKRFVPRTHVYVCYFLVEESLYLIFDYELRAVVDSVILQYEISEAKDISLTDTILVNLIL